MSQPETLHTTARPEDSSNSAAESLRGTVIALSVAMLVFACIAATFLEFRSRSAHMAMANLPLAVLLPFVAWLLANALFEAVCSLAFPDFGRVEAGPEHALGGRFICRV